MFGLPDAKRVRRDELYTPTSSRDSSPDPALTELLRNRMADMIYSNTAISLKDTDETLDSGINSHASVKDSEDSEPEFSLFAPKSNRVSRKDLYSPASSIRSSPNPALVKLLRNQAQNISFMDVSTTNKMDGDIDNNPNAEEEEKEDELEFHLFAPTAAQKSTAAPPQRIRLDSPSERGKQGFVVAQRPPDYYFSIELDEARRAQLATTAVSGEDVLRRAKTSWPGSAMPWRVTEISSKGLPKEVLAGHKNVVVEEKARKRKRAGKKARIKRRNKAEEMKMKRQEAEKSAAEKELAEREKRARRNREKKLKKRARDKAKKASGDAVGDAGLEVGSGDES